MKNSLGYKKLLSYGKELSIFAGILLVLLVIFSCNNILITSGGSLIISTPGARAASDSISYTIVVEGSQGSTQRKTLTSGSSVQFDNLAPDTYSISVEGKNKDDVLVFSGTKSATVTAGETSSVMVELEKLVGSLTVDFSESDTSSATEFKVELNIGDTPFKSTPPTSGTTVQFDDLAPGAYNIVVEGMDASGSVVFYGTRSATVEAGKTESADVELKKGASDFASLESAVAAGGTVYIFESIDVETTLSVLSGITVNILPAYQDVTLKNIGSGSLFDVNSGELTIGGGEYTITLDGNTLSHHAIYVQYTGKATLSTNAVIMNCGTSGVKLYNPNYDSSAIFCLEGGSIMGNNGSGVEMSSYGSKFHMKSGIIEKNKATDGGGVKLDDGKFYLDGGSITGNNAGTETTSGNGGGVYINTGYLYMNGGSITGNTSTGSGGGVYSTKAIIMTGGLIEGNSTSGSGNGVFFNGDREFEMSGSAVIAPDNDVYLSKTKIITITGELTGDSPVATITPYTEGYAEAAQVLKAGGDVDLSKEYQKFAVTNTAYTIDSSGTVQPQAGAQ